MVNELTPTVLRQEFPQFSEMRNGKPPIPLNAACQPLRLQVSIDAETEYQTKYPACGGKRGARFGWPKELDEKEGQARSSSATLLNARSDLEIVLVKNTTEAINFVAAGLPLTSSQAPKILTTRREHNSNIAPYVERERREAGLPWTPKYDRPAPGDRHRILEFIDLAADGSFSLANALEAVDRYRPALVSLGHTSNLDGVSISDDDLRAVAKAVHEHGGLVLLDAAQSAPHRAVDVQALGIDFLAMSFHKMGGPSALGVLWGRREALETLTPTMVGGGTINHLFHEAIEYQDVPYRFEAGLQHYSGIVAVPAVVRYVSKRVGFKFIEEHEHHLNTYLTEQLLGIGPAFTDAFRILGPLDPSKRGGILTIAAKHDNRLISAIERIGDENHNIMVRTGAFCSNGYIDYVSGRKALSGNLRVSLNFYNTESDLDAFVETVSGVVLNPRAAIAS